jgi:1-deoxy-D-xylulose-5-phosphate reductoisomerase
MKKRIVILGSTGSIGRSTLDVVENCRDEFEIVGLACRESSALFSEQIRKFKPRWACLCDQTREKEVDFGISRKLLGLRGLKELAGVDADLVVNALPGSTGLEPSIEALSHNRTLALANKESLVMAGRLIMGLTRSGRGRLIPVDSEHSALFQLMEGSQKEEIEKLLITASGGPFKNHSREELAHVSPEDALCHPTWQMGRKVTIDSATLMNKGFEVIEAHWLFGAPSERIEVLVHPESVIHGIVQFVDGCFFAYLAHPDMRIPIAYALNGGRRFPLPFGKADFANLGKLTFYEPDTTRFPALRLAYDALAAGDSALVVLNAANEVASSAFLEGRIPFTSIPELAEEALTRHAVVREIQGIETVLEVHGWARDFVEGRLRRKDAS